MPTVVEFKSRRQRDIEEIVTEVQKQEASGQFSAETADLVSFVSTLKSVKNLKVYNSQGKPLHLKCQKESEVSTVETSLLFFVEQNANKDCEEH